MSLPLKYKHIHNHRLRAISKCKVNREREETKVKKSLFSSQQNRKLLACHYHCTEPMHVRGSRVCGLAQ